MSELLYPFAALIVFAVGLVGVVSLFALFIALLSYKQK